MGKVIILAGAPDAASLDWSELEDNAGSRGPTLGDPQAEAGWQHGDSNNHGLASEHPQWRSVPLRRSRNSQDELSSEPSPKSFSRPSKPPTAVEEQEEIVDLGESVQVQVQREWAEQAVFDCADVASFNGSGSQSQQQDWSVSSADIPSLSVRIPGALPPPPPPEFRDTADPEVQASTPSCMFSGETSASQDLIEHSLAVHDALPSSLPDPSDFSTAPEVTALTVGFEETASPVGTGSSFAASLIKVPPPLPAAIPRWRPLTHLVDIPSADFVTNIKGRTVTVNIVAAVVAASTPRDVYVKQHANNPNRPPTSSLVELVLGDDTKSGFGITIWLDTPARGPQPGGLLPPRPPSLASGLPTLHPQDIVLVQNLSLNVFNGRVYGSALRRNMTQMHVLFRQRHSGDGDQSLFSTSHLAAADAAVAARQSTMAPDWWLAAKTTRVREWALRYVFAGNRSSSNALVGAAAVGNIWVQPPVDTQETQYTQ